ncbi:hypothetical protein, partial [Serratia fonticola]|uniref:hypothetical protein n=1 Tax=Serratia fonticola TaxID=47917 RepID=UPI0024DEE815
IAARSVELPGVLGRIVLLRKVGNKNKKGNVLLKAINEFDRFPLPLGAHREREQVQCGGQVS